MRLARLFVDDRNAAEDLVQEAFIRLARSAHRIEDPARAPAYLRSIVLNLARDHNRRGLVSLRHRSRSSTSRPASRTRSSSARTSDRCSTRSASFPLASGPASCCATTTSSASTTSRRRSASPATRSRRTSSAGLAALEARLATRRRGMTTLEERLRDALRDGALTVDESPDLFDPRGAQHRRRPAPARPAPRRRRGRRLHRRRARRRRRRRHRYQTGRAAHGLVDTRADHHRRAGGDRLLAGAVHQALRAQLRGRRVPRQPAHRQELHRADRRRLLPDLLLLHPVHGELRAARGPGTRR